MMSERSLSYSKSSFRDPAGFVFQEDGQIYRQINQFGKADFDHFMSSGLYSELASRNLIVTHQEVSPKGFPPDTKRYKLIKPKQLTFISYPYEWCFSQLKDAALLTLEVQKLALSHGMILKDASAYNVQFVGRRPIFIDTLSFRKYEPGMPWEGYRQFCEHFLATLALARYTTPDVIKSLRVFLDGIPLSTAPKLLPHRAKLQRGLTAHIFLHAASQRRFERTVTGKDAPNRALSSLALQGLIASLERTVKRLKLPAKRTEWGRYYEDTNYSDRAFASKQKVVKDMIARISPKPTMAWDLGANDGTFSEIVAEYGAYVASFDVDHNAVEINYSKTRDSKLSELIQPLIQDFTNPSPALGWSHNERQSLIERGPADVVLALALVHHLAIGNNLPLPAIAEFFSAISKNLIIEFVPKSDSKTQLLLHRRANLFEDYLVENFEKAFAKHFSLLERSPISDSERVIYLYRAKR